MTRFSFFVVRKAKQDLQDLQDEQDEESKVDIGFLSWRKASG